MVAIFFIMVWQVPDVIRLFGKAIKVRRSSCVKRTFIIIVVDTDSIIPIIEGWQALVATILENLG